jgi:hypothetical protein
MMRGSTSYQRAALQLGNLQNIILKLTYAGTSIQEGTHQGYLANFMKKMLSDKKRSTQVAVVKRYENLSQQWNTPDKQWKWLTETGTSAVEYNDEIPKVRLTYAKSTFSPYHTSTRRENSSVSMDPVPGPVENWILAIIAYINNKNMGQNILLDLKETFEKFEMFFKETEKTIAQRDVHRREQIISNANEKAIAAFNVYKMTQTQSLCV